MIETIDIQNHITKRLKDNFPSCTVYTEGNQTDPKVPAFYVSIRPILTTGAMKYKNRVVNVNIMYLSEKGLNKERLIMIDKLEDVFHLILTVKKRTLQIESLSISELDGVLNLGFTLDYSTVATGRDTSSDATDYMEILEVNKGDD